MFCFLTNYSGGDAESKLHVKAGRIRPPHLAFFYFFLNTKGSLKLLEISPISGCPFIGERSRSCGLPMVFKK